MKGKPSFGGLITAILAVLLMLGGGPAIAKEKAAQAAKGKAAPAAEEKAPQSALSKLRRVYFPGTEELAPDEMRIIACGTGSPQARLKQAAACFLVQLGNGDNLIFDMGAGSNERLVSLDIPTDQLDKVFIGHLHLDHVGDLPNFYFTRSVNNGTTPVRVWGPSGVKPEWGFKAAMENMKKMFGWERAMRAGLMAEIPLEVHEFDWKGINQVIYNENGATVRTIPAVHGDQSVSFILEWNGLKFAFSSDTVPNKWWMQYTKGADISIHETFFAPEEMVSVIGFSPAEALNVATQIHTPPQGFAYAMAQTRPRLAVAYHFHNDFNYVHMVRDKIRETYDGPLDMATDFMVWNVTKKEIRTRLAVVSPDRVAPPRTGPKKPGDPKSYQYDELTLTGIDPGYGAVVQKIYADFNKKHGTDYKPLLKFAPPPGVPLDQ
ncbi:MAG: guanitoxin biosynthesis MBL fold metallo-hydrolase GntH [Pseudomonadota bacterium]